MKINSTERTLAILTLLLAQPMSVADIQRHFSDKGYDNISSDAIYEDIKKLKNVGFVISEANKRTNFLYSILQTPFEQLLGHKELNSLAYAYSVLENSNDPHLKKFEKALDIIDRTLNLGLDDLLPDIHNKEEDKFTDYDTEDMQKLIEYLYKLCNDKQEIEIEYQSQKRKEPKKYKIFPIDVENNNGVFYLIGCKQGHSEKYEFRIERLTGQPSQLPTKMPEILMKQVFAKFRLYPPISKMYKASANESVSPDDENKEAIIVHAPYKNELRLFQKLVRYGEYAEILYPPQARDYAVKILNKMQNVYSKQDI